MQLAGCVTDSRHVPIATLTRCILALHRSPPLDSRPRLRQFFSPPLRRIRVDRAPEDTQYLRLASPQIHVIGAELQTAFVGRQRLLMSPQAGQSVTLTHIAFWVEAW